MSIYVASSWRNTTHLDEVINRLRADGHEDVYDFRASAGFSWEQCDPSWDRNSMQTATPPLRITELLRHPAAVKGYGTDLDALDFAQLCVLVMPCGRSAHLELGYAIGRGKPSIVYLPEPCEPELMWKLASAVASNLDDVSWWAAQLLFPVGGAV